MGAEEDLGGTVPEGYDLVGEGTDGGAEGAGEAEVGELEAAVAGDEEVLRFQVPDYDQRSRAERYVLESAPSFS